LRVAFQPIEKRALLLWRSARLAGTLYDIYDKDAYVDRIVALLDDLESRQSGLDAGLGFRPSPRAAD